MKTRTWYYIYIVETQGMPLVLICNKGLQNKEEVLCITRCVMNECFENYHKRKPPRTTSIQPPYMQMSLEYFEDFHFEFVMTYFQILSWTHVSHRADGNLTWLVKIKTTVEWWYVVNIMCLSSEKFVNMSCEATLCKEYLEDEHQLFFCHQTIGGDRKFSIAMRGKHPTLVKNHQLWSKINRIWKFRAFQHLRDKVSGPCVLTLHIWTPISVWYIDSLVVMNEHKNTHATVTLDQVLKMKALL